MNAHADSPKEDNTSRERFTRVAEQLSHLLMILLLVLAIGGMALYFHLYYCRIPAGTKVIDASVARPYSPLGEYIAGLSLTKKIPWILPYLQYRYYIIPDGAKELHGGFRQNKYVRSVSIPDSVTKIYSRAFEGCENLRDVRLPSGTKTLPDVLFAGCTALESIRIPEGVKLIDNSAFYGCSNLREVVLPDSLEMIKDRAFYKCSALTSIRVPDKVRLIGEGAFSYCTSLRKVDISDNLMTIEREAFMDCSSLEEFRLPAAMARAMTKEEHNEEARQRRVLQEGRGYVDFHTQAIYPRVFAGCTSLKKVVIPDGIKIIDGRAFACCTSLSDIRIPDSVTSIGTSAFVGCRNLPPITIGKQIERIDYGAFSGTNCRLTVPDDHPFIQYEGGLLYYKRPYEKRRLLSCVTVPEDGRVVVPSDVGEYSVGTEAFAMCTGLKEVRLPDGLKIISSNLFWGCTGLERVELPDSITEIWGSSDWMTGGRENSGAFAGCASLKSITIPPNVKEIPYNTFQNCTSLEEVSIPDGVTVIGERAFRNCVNLKHVTLPSSLKTLGRTAFDGCTALEKPILPPGAAVRSEDNWFEWDEEDEGDFVEE